MRRAAKYSRVPTDERPASAARQAASTTRKWATKASTMAHSAFWLLLATFVCYHSDLIQVLQYDPRLDRVALTFAVLGLSVFWGAVLYMAVWIPLTVPVPIADLEKWCPRVVHSAAIAGGVAIVAGTKALWPVWGWVTLPMVSIITLATLFTPNLLPLP